MSGRHSHDHGGGGSNPADHRRRLAIVLALTGTVLVVEVIGAWVSGSLALLADAGHMATDTAGPAISLIAATLALRPSTPKRTWGYRRAKVLGATLQAAALLAVGGYVLIEGVRRLFEPEEIATTAVLVFGVVGLVANAIGIAPRHRGHVLSERARAQVLDQLQACLAEHFPVSVEHSTFQLETSTHLSHEAAAHH